MAKLHKMARTQKDDNVNGGNPTERETELTAIMKRKNETIKEYGNENATQRCNILK